MLGSILFQRANFESAKRQAELQMRLYQQARRTTGFRPDWTRLRPGAEQCNGCGAVTRCGDCEYCGRPHGV